VTVFVLGILFIVVAVGLLALVVWEHIDPGSAPSLASARVSSPPAGTAAPSGGIADFSGITPIIISFGVLGLLLFGLAVSGKLAKNEIHIG